MPKHPTHGYATLPVLASLVLAASAVAFIPQDSIADDGTQSLQSGANQLSVAASDTTVDADDIQTISDKSTPATNSDVASATEIPAADVADIPQGDELSSDEPQSSDTPQSADIPQSAAENFPGMTAFFNTGSSIFPTGTHTCEPGIFWELSSTGSIRKIVDGTLTDDYSIPYGTFNWGTCGSLQSSGKCPDDAIKNSSGVGFYPVFVRPTGTRAMYFDGLGRYSGGLFAFQTKGLDTPTANPGGEGVVIHQYRTGDDRWYALTRNGAVLNEWQNTSRDSILAPPEYITSGTTGVGGSITPSYVYNGSNYTFNNAYTYFTMGTALPDGTYIFGGTGRAPNSSGTDIKLFARRVDGSIIYLGYFPFKEITSAAFTGDIVTDKDGNIYVGAGSVFYGTTPATEKIVINKLTAATIQDRLQRPAALWNGSSWVSGSGAAFSLNANTYKGTSTGTNIVPMTASAVASLTLTMPDPYRPTQFAGFDIAPNGNIVIGTRVDEKVYVSGRGWTYPSAGLFFEFDKNGQKVDGGYANTHYTPPFNWRVDQGDSNKEVTDMSGCATPPPMRTLTVYKSLAERSKSTDQFKFDVTISSRGENTQLTGQTSGSATGTQLEVGITQHRLAAGSAVSLTESALGNTSMGSYDTRLDCFDRDAAVNLGSFVSDTGSIHIPSPPAGLDPTRAKGIWCTFKNTAKVAVDVLATKVDATDNRPMANVPFTLYKDNGTGTAHDVNQPVPTVPNGTTTSATTSSSGQVTWAKLQPGIYWIVEGNPPAGYEKLPPQKLEIVKGDPNLKKITLTNTRKPGALTVEKVAEVGKQKLAGSKWRLVGPNGYDKTITDFAGSGAAPSTSNDANNAAGVIQVNGLPWGDYTLTEIEAPAGFERSTQQWRFTISATALSKQFTGVNAITNRQHTGPAIPFTGGLDRDSFIIGGFILLGGAAGVSLAFGRKRRTVPSNK